MKGFWFSIPLIFSGPLLHAQQKFAPGDSLKQPLTTVAPLLGGVNVSYIVSPVKDAYTTHQVIVDESSPIYKVMKTRHPLLVKTGVRYQGLYLSGAGPIGVSDFHSIAASMTATYVLSRNVNVTAIIDAGVASDFKRDVSGSDIFYSAGLRLGLRQATNFKIGVSVVYAQGYSGSYLLALPDIDWKISNKWSLEAFAPFRTSLKYKLDTHETLALTQGFNTIAYRLNDNSGIQKYLQLQQVTAGLMYEHTFNRRWSARLIAGYAFSSKLETFGDDQKVSFENFGALNKRVRDISYSGAEVLAQVGISYKF